MPGTLHRPEPILAHEARPIDRDVAPRQAAAWLRAGKPLLVRDHWTTGGDALARLHLDMEPPDDDASYAHRRAFRQAYHRAAMGLLAPVRGHRIALEHSPSVVFLRELYPELSSFVLPFPELQDLANASRRYAEGVHLSVLGHRVHPFYGTYAPTRTTHLELFGTWLSQYRGSRHRGIDVGTGCGVLALMLCRAGFGRVLATDNNPNAIESVARELSRLPTAAPIDLFHGDLLGDDPSPADLIVFNPPWLGGQGEGLLGQALGFDDGLFGRFFDQALDRLAPNGRVALLFSNVLGLVQPDLPHPIETELERGRFRLVGKLERRVKPTAAGGGRRRRTRERVEIWELGKG